jgi:hypothetical protein
MIRVFRPVPRAPQPGDTLKQIVLNIIGYRDSRDMGILMKYVNNLALSRRIEQIFFLCENKHPLLGSIKGFIHIDTAMHLYVKPLQESVSLNTRPVFLNGLDI